MVLGLFGSGEDDIAHLGLSAEAPAVAPAGEYQVRVRVVEAKDLSAISSFSLYQSLMSMSFKTQVESTNRLPNVVTRVLLQRDGFKTQKRKTMVEKETSSPLWNQLFYFDEVEVAEGELDACTLTFSVADKSRIGKDMVIGTCDINLAAVYQEDTHELWNEWLTLTDQKGRREGSQGQLCVCVTVLRSTDEPVMHVDAGDFDDEPAVGVAPSEDNVDLETWILRAQLYSGRDLPRMDRFGKAGVDAYLCLQCGSSKPVKSTNKASRNPEWNQELILRMVVPPGKGGIASLPAVKMSLMDADYDKDDHIASQHIHLRDLLLNPKEYLQPKWYAFYGGPREMELALFSRVSKLAKRMNAGYIDGSAYRGRVLIGMQLMKETKAIRGIRPKKKIPSVLGKLGKEWPCILHAEVYGVELTNSRHVGKSVSVELNIGLSKCKSPSKTLKSEGGALAKDCYAGINVRMPPMRVKLPQPFEGPLAGDGAPDLFVDVYVGTSTSRKRVGYCRVPCKHLMPVKETHTPMNAPSRSETWKLQGWFQLHSDALGCHVRGQSRRAEHVRPVGQVLLRMMIHGSPVAKRQAHQMTEEEILAGGADKDLDGDGIDDDAEEQAAEGGAAEDKKAALERRADQRGERKASLTPAEPIEKLQKQRYMLQVQLYQAKNLPSSDAQGASDPFAVLRCGRNQAQTQVCKATTSPAWFQEIFLEVELPLIPREKRKSKRGVQQDEEQDEEQDDEGNEHSDEDVELGNRSSFDNSVPGEGASSSGRAASSSGMSLGEAASRGIRPGGGGAVGGFEGIAWWGAPSLSVVVFDQDEGVLGNDTDALSICTLPLIHPNARPPVAGGNPGDQPAAPPSTLASSASMWSALSIDDMLPDQFDDLSKYRVGLVEPEWHGLRQLNPASGGGGVQFRHGGDILLHYSLKEVPPEGTYRYTGNDAPKMRAAGSLPRVVRPLGDFFGSNPVEVQVLLLGLRGMEPFRRIPIGNPYVEIELTGAMPLFPGCPFTIAKSSASSNPSGANANFNGEVLRLRGRVHKLDKIELTLSIRVIDKLPFKRMVGTANYSLSKYIRGEEEEVEAPGGKKKKKRKKLKAIKAKAMTPEEQRELDVMEMESTESESDISESSATTVLADSSDTVTQDEDDMSVPAPSSSDRSSWMDRAASTVQTGLSIAKSLKRSATKSITRNVRGFAGGSVNNDDPYSLKFDANDVPLMDKSASRSGSIKSRSTSSSKAAGTTRKRRGKKTGGGNLETVAEDNEGSVVFSRSHPSDDGRTVDSGAETSECSTDDDSDPDNNFIQEKDQQVEDDEEDDEEDEDEDDNPNPYNDGSGQIPEWMDRRMMVTDGTLDDYIQPVPFITVPVMHAKGFSDNSSTLVKGGCVKFAVRVLPLRQVEVEEELLEEDSAGKSIVGMFSSRARKKKEMRDIMRQDSGYVVDEDVATMPRDEFLELQRLVGGGPSALLPQNIMVRAYVVRGQNLRPLDPSGLCDPYLKVELQGTNKRFGRRGDKVLETLSPWFYKMFQFNTELPGSSQLEFKLLDWDKNGGDDLIGLNVVDLEDRWFSHVWKSDFAERPPLEIRPLMNPDCIGNQGQLELWVEMYQDNEEVPKAPTITPPPVIDVEMRVVIFKARKMVNKDVMQNQNDLFFKCNLVGIDHKGTRFGEVQETDTHYFATDGKGSFNYRLIYRFTLPVMKAKLRVSAYDRDFFAANDNIGEANINLTDLCGQLMREIKMRPEGELAPDAIKEIKATSGLSTGLSFDSFLDGPDEGMWVPLYHPSKNEIVQGEVEVLVQLLPVKKAEQRPVGKAREQPNRDPELRQPVRQTLNPFDPLGSLAILIGPDLLRKLLIVGICMLCLFVSCSLAVFVINDVLSAYINIAIQKASGQVPGSGLPPNSLG